MLHFFRKTESFFAANPIAGFLLLFCISAALFTYIQFQPSFRDPDSFYHAKMAMLMLRGGIVHDFPWLPFTMLSSAYADHHFLYHVALVPFIAVFGPLVGTKAAAIVFAALAIAVFYAMLRAMRVRFAFWFALTLLMSGGFIFRLNLAKASSLSLIVLFVALALIARRRVLPLFALAWMYVWTYGGWPILAVVAAATLISKAIADHLQEEHPLHSWAGHWYWRRLFANSRHAWRHFFGTIELRQAGAIIAGLVAGVVINPFFPSNIAFYWQQVVRIAVVNDHGGVGVGAEWYPISLGTLFGDAGIAFILLAAAIAMVAIAATANLRRKSVANDDMKLLTLLALLAGLFFGLALRSHRHMEYFVPLLIAFDAVLMHAIISRLGLREMLGAVRKAVGMPAMIGAATLIAGVGIALGAHSIIATRTLYDDGIRWTMFSRAAAWLQTHAPAGSIIFHSDWDDFPPLFFYDDRERYIIGLDPRFLADADAQKYQQWADVSTGKRRQGLHALITGAFHARYVLVENDHSAMREAIERDGGFDLAYADDEAHMYIARQ